MKFRPCRVAGRGRLHYRDKVLVNEAAKLAGLANLCLFFDWVGSWAMTNTVLPSVGCGDLFPLHACAWTIPCHNLRTARFFLSSSQHCPTVLSELISALSKCSQAEKRDTEWCWASLQGRSCCGCLNARYLHTSLDCSHHWQICLMKNHICTLEGPALVSPFLHWDWVVIWAGTSSWHSQAPSLCFFCSWFWSSDCSKWADFIWPCANKKFFWHLRL